MSEALEHLRIIAADAKGLAATDRAIIRHAADEFEALQRQLLVTQEQLLHAQARRIATNDQLLSARRRLANPHVPMSITLYAGPLRGYRLP